MSFHFENDWEHDELFNQARIIDIGFESISIHNQKSFTFVVAGLGISIFWNDEIDYNK